MTIAAPSEPTRQHYARVLRHFASSRGVEVCALQASPLLGAYLGDLAFQAGDLRRVGLLLIGSTALTAHAFLVNDSADYRRDAHDLRRPSLNVDRRVITRGQIACVAIGLLVVATVALAALGTSAMLFGAGIAGVSVLYSFSPRLGKSTPIAASLNHLIGGALLFLLGYSVSHDVGATGVVLSLVFGLVFAAGHLNQEVRDHEFDLANGVGTVAVTFGCRRGFLASFWLFTAAYLLIGVLAAAGVLPRFLLASTVLWLMHGRWSLQALRRGPGTETALWMQRRYRLLFALVGLAMLIR